MRREKNEIFRVRIEDMSDTGEGIGKTDGFTWFVKDAVIGDLVEAKVMKVKKSYGFARLMKVLKPSPHRVTPPCPVASSCGGCQLQAMSYEEQLRFKERKVLNNLRRIGGLDCREIWEPIIGMEDPWHYRNKALFPIGRNKEGKIITGFFAGRTHSIIENTDCLLGAPENARILACIRNYMEEYGVAPYEEKTHTGLVRHVLIRKGFRTGQILVCLVINGAVKELRSAEILVERLLGLFDEGRGLGKGRGFGEERGFDEGRGFNEGKEGGHKETVEDREGRPRIVTVACSINRKQTNVILGTEIVNLYGTGSIVDFIGSIQYQISPLSFYQVNPRQTERLYEMALEYAGLTGEETVWDLYCGIGTISLFLAQRAKRVCGVEIIPQAIEDARRNAEQNGIKNVGFFTGKAEEVLPEQYEKNHIQADVIVVDPPRKGCDPMCLETMIKMAPERIVYVSCDSATLARDLRYLTENGYEVRRGRCCDMFGGTVHVETCVLLTHKKPTSYIEVTMDYETIVPNPKPRRATYKMITDYVKEKYDLVVKSTTIAEVKRSFGLEVGDYNVKEEKTNYRKEKITPKKRQAVEDALRHFGVVE